MSLTDKFYEAVKLGDVQSVRIMMKDSLLTDPSFKQFEQMEKYSSSLKGLYEEHDGRDFQDKSTWNDSYMNKLMVQVVNNFSHERVEHLKDVIHYLRPISNSMAESEFFNSQNKISGDKNQTDRNEKKYLTVKGSEYQKQKARDQKDGNYSGAKMPVGVVACGVVAGSVVGGVAASVVALPVVGGVITGAVVGAAGTIAVSKIKEKRD
ncbi:hypothetical protein GMB34_13840 [Turicibacter sanguinis]|uniref:hypothetical protein n=1 Tax=Turicibacter sanguinis TaxID=154288 RepID=UPI0012BBF7B9|nr:hypothetical protein [Turicibacter sanguinis]MTN82227.1 hypothetical protein [Turicibacter sanguinis]MTN83161.1 hypothetical protein [Turicibacter sanguinis]MTN88119.1 hypothetical protein [Turicibacter sanguinis]MTN90974.1 hypothetical protein [Turicibacter sanguinis]MTN93609.1 hypothetical protein [Turicibacter sanguinis]